MTPWTDPARRELETWVEAVRRDYEATGASAEEAAEIAADLRRHVEEELAGEALPATTVDDVRRVTARIALPSDAATSSEFAHPSAVRAGLGDAGAVVFRAETPPRPSTPSRPMHGCLVFGGGVVLPLVALAAEYATGTWRSHAFDPVPTPWHALAILTVPAATLAATEGRAGDPRRMRWLGPLTAVACGASFWYALLTLPFLPLCALGTLYFGLGLVAASPVFAFAASWSVRREALPPGSKSGRWWGVATFAALACFAGVDMRARTLSRRALGDDEAEARVAQEALRAPWMRLPTPKRRGFDGFGSERGVSVFDAERLRWLVLGEAPRTLFDEDDVGDDDLRWGLRRNNLALEATTFDAVIDSDRALSYGEMTFVFRNDDTWDQEAALLLDLPDGGSVTRASLWNQGVEVPAAFAPVQKARDAYESVVSRRRDPILVTAYGRDRVMMQCFPVPARGAMKVRIGVTAPLTPVAMDAARFDLPTVVRFNGAAADGGEVAVELHGPGALEGSGGAAAVDGRLRFRRPDSKQPGALALRRPTPFPAVEDLDDLGDGGFRVKQTLALRPARARRCVVVAVDGAASFDGARAAVLRDLDALAGDREIALVVSDHTGLRTAVEPAPATPETVGRFKETLGGLPTRGDRDDLPLLKAALDLASLHAPSAVVWLRGIQPIPERDPEGVLHRLRRAPADVVVYDAPYLAGAAAPHLLADRLAESPAYRRTRGDGVKGAFLALPDAAPGAERLVALRSRVAPADGGAESSPASRAKSGGSHLARLWARDEVDRLLLRGAPGDTERASALSLRYGLVTEVVGSVALESSAQMAEYDLQAPQPGATPRIPVSDVPEPGTVALLAVAGLVGCRALVRRRRDRSAAT